MTDRDTFAAAALPGLLVNGPFNTDAVPRLAYSLADAMLRERSLTGQAAADTTPQSRAGTTSQSHEESDEKRMNTNTNRDTTPSEDSVQGEFTDTVFKTLVERISLTQSLLDENERLRRAIRLLADQDATLSVQGGNVTVTLDATLTREERAAIELALSKRLDLDAIYTLRNLLERLS
jgi:hypothetical protein